MAKARGSVIRRGGKWAVVLDLGRDANGRRIRHWHSGYESQEDAEKARTALLSRFDGGEYMAPSRVTLGEYLRDQWLPSLDVAVAGGNLKENTAASYRTQCNSYIIPRLGHVKLKDLTVPMLVNLYGELLQSGRRRPREGGPTGLSRTSVHLVHVTLSKALRDAVAWGLTSRNIATAASDKAPKPRKTGKTTFSIWTPAQLRQFIDRVRGDRLYAMWLLFTTTGMRRGEVAGLRWLDLDLERRRLEVNQAHVVVEHKLTISTPKTEGSERAISIDPVTNAALKAHKARQAAERLAWGAAYNPSDLVFTWENGQPLHPNVLSRTFARLADKAGLPPIRLHDLRHSYATAALEAGEPMKVIQERLGHSSIGITSDVYSHVRPEVDQATGDRVANRILGGAS